MRIPQLEELSGRLYAICITTLGFELRMTDELLRLITEYLSKNNIRTSLYVKDLRALIERAVTVDRMARFEFNLPFITFPNYKHVGIDWNTICSIASEIGQLLDLVRFVCSEECFNPNASYFVDPDERHNMWIELHSSRNHNSIEVIFSELAYQKMKALSNHGDIKIRPAVEVVAEWYDRLTIKSQRRFIKQSVRRGRTFGHMGISVYIRAGYGVPSIIVPGNCACFGANPDEFKYDRKITPHNLDTPLQLLLMLVAVAKLDEWLDEQMKM